MPAGEYQSPLTDSGIADTKSQIEKLLADAKAAKAEADRKAANQAAYVADMTAINQLQASLNAMKEKIQADYPDFVNDEAQNAVQVAITNLYNGAAAALAAVASEGNYVPVATEAKVAEINAKINALLTQAQAAKEAARVAANKAAYDADMAKIAELQANYDATVLDIRADYKDYEDVRANAAVQKAINDAKAAIEAAYKAVAAEGTYATPADFDSQALQAQIDKLLADAKVRKEAADAEAARVAANQAAYDADMAQANALQAALNEAIAKIDSEYAGYDSADEEAVVQAQITALINAANAEKERVAASGTYTDQVSDAQVTEITAAINKLVDDAKARKEAADAEAEQARKNANYNAYKADSTAIAGLQHDLDQAIQTIRDNYAGYENTADENAVKSEIEALMQAAKAELARVENSGTYQSVASTSQIEAISAKIEKLIDDAAARKQAAEDEAKRKADNLAAYEADLAAINELQNELNAMAAKIQDELPDKYSATEVNNVQKMINDAKAAVESAYRAVENEGTYQTPTEFDADAIKAAIENLWALANSIYDILLDSEGDVEVYDLRGIRIKEPGKGTVNIVRSRSSVTKTIFK